MAGEKADAPSSQLLQKVPETGREAQRWRDSDRLVPWFDRQQKFSAKQEYRCSRLEEEGGKKTLLTS